jgi:hypothetical protein
MRPAQTLSCCKRCGGASAITHGTAGLRLIGSRDNSDSCQETRKFQPVSLFQPVSFRVHWLTQARSRQAQAPALAIDSRLSRLTPPSRSTPARFDMMITGICTARRGRAPHRPSDRGDRGPPRRGRRRRGILPVPVIRGVSQGDMGPVRVQVRRLAARLTARCQPCRVTSRDGGRRRRRCPAARRPPARPQAQAAPAACGRSGPGPAASLCRLGQ